MERRFSHGPAVRRLTAAAVFCLTALPAGADGPVRADVAAMEFTRTQAPGLESALSRPGTELKILLTHGEDNWRGFDFSASRVTAFVDDSGGNLALADPIDPDSVAVGLQRDASSVAPDGRSAVVAVWGGGLPSKGADQLRVEGTVALFCGPAEEQAVDRADVRLAGGETFNVQPFRVVTGRGDGALQVELRYLKNAALVRSVSLSTSAGGIDPTGAGAQSESGEEWVWRGEFVLPAGETRGNLSIRYLAIDNVASVPFDITVGVAFRTPPTNPVLRWLKRYL